MPLKNKGNDVFRQPYPNERQWITSVWVSELKKQHRPNAGKGFLVLAIACTVALALRVLTAPTDVAGAVVWGLCTAGCWYIASGMRKGAKSCEHHIKMLEQGAFLVMPAIACKAHTADDGYYYNGYVAVARIDGTALGQFRMPYDMAKSLEQQHCQDASILLVKVEGKNEMIAVLTPR